MTVLASWSHRTLGLVLGATPLVTINLCYLVATAAGHIPACIPYLVGCTTTSSTGREFPERLLFWPGMLLAAMLIALFWRRVAAQIGHNATIRWLGFVAALLLATYTVAIGQPYEAFRVMRRVGAGGYFVANFLAQVLFVIALARRADVSGAGRTWLLVLCAAVPLTGLGGELAIALGLPHRAVHNVVEWNALVMVCGFYAVAGAYLPNRSAGRPASPRE